MVPTKCRAGLLELHLQMECIAALRMQKETLKLRKHCKERIVKLGDVGGKGLRIQKIIFRLWA